MLGQLQTVQNEVLDHGMAAAERVLQLVVAEVSHLDEWQLRQRGQTAQLVVVNLGGRINIGGIWIYLTLVPNKLYINKAKGRVYS